MIRAAFARFPRAPALNMGDNHPKHHNCDRRDKSLQDALSLNRQGITPAETASRRRRSLADPALHRCFGWCHRTVARYRSGYGKRHWSRPGPVPPAWQQEAEEGVLLAIWHLRQKEPRNGARRSLADGMNGKLDGLASQGSLGLSHPAKGSMRTLSSRTRATAVSKTTKATVRTRPI